MILPLRVLGREATNSISCGIARGDNFLRMKFMISNSRSSFGSCPGLSATNALTTSMLTGSGLPTAADSATAGCSRSADSISNGPTRWPPVLMTSSSRPTNQKYPSASTLARSPQMYHPFLNFPSYVAWLFQ